MFVASHRDYKLFAAAKAFEQFALFAKFDRVTFIPIDTQSGIPSLPRSSSQTISGCRNRICHLAKLASEHVNAAFAGECKSLFSASHLVFLVSMESGTISSPDTTGQDFTRAYHHDGAFCMVAHCGGGFCGHAFSAAPSIAFNSDHSTHRPTRDIEGHLARRVV